MDDILNSGGAFTPEKEITEITLTKEEKEAINEAENEIRETNILLKSPAWERAKINFLTEIENMKNQLPGMVENKSSLEDIGLEYKVCMMTEKKIVELINSIESLEGAKDE